MSGLRFATCNCPVGMRYHANNCPTQPGRLQNVPDWAKSKRVRPAHLTGPSVPADRKETSDE